MSHDVDVIVVGAGVVGLACARALAKEGLSTLILEKNARFGSEISSRNSEVVHAGIYYPPESEKARLCVRGKQLLYDFCDSYGVQYHRCGKLIVATQHDQIERLHGLMLRAKENGVVDIRYIDQGQARDHEPELMCTAALYSPSTGIIDSHGLMLALLGDAERFGAELVVRTPVEQIIITSTGFEVLTGGSSPTIVKTKHLLNAAGLSAAAVASKIDGLDSSHIPKLYLAKGNYYSLQEKAPFNHLVYPLPEPGGLGIHFTIDLSGHGRFGPDVQWTDEIDYKVDTNLAARFYFSIQKYWPRVRIESLSPAYCGIRPKLAGPLVPDADFLLQDSKIHKLPGLVNLYGIESPGLTASLAIAEKCKLLINHER